MDLQQVFCPNPACLASGAVGVGNIGVHSQRNGRYRCKMCGTTFSHRRGTPFYRAHTQAEMMTVLIGLVAHGCPIEAIAAVFGFQARTVGSLHTGMYLIGTIYNLCTFHDSLLSEQGVKRTPAMATGITDHRWTLQELLWHRLFIIDPPQHKPKPLSTPSLLPMRAQPIPSAGLAA